MWHRLAARTAAVWVMALSAACGPVRPGFDTCKLDTDCAEGLICSANLCLVPSRADAGADADAGAVDAGTAADAGCTANLEVELCNGVDDDCDGVVDEQPLLINPDGGLVSFDGGTGAPDGTCSVGVGACAHTGLTQCGAGALTCSVVAGPPGVEVCNGIDDDCDGEVDEVGVGLCPNSGELCTNATCGCPAPQRLCGSSCVSLGGACAVGVGECARSGSNVCDANGSVTCDATAGAPAAELCNGRDDDCDGQTDEPGQGLCAATGQLCTNGTCACPSGQQVCNGVCLVLTAEVCDGLDNDCDGQIDEGVTITCLGDADDDRYATSTDPHQVCADASRVLWGTCPLGYVSPATKLGTDCDDTSAAVYRVEGSRVDADGDTFCTGPNINDCVGAGPNPGRRFTASCTVGPDDCNDASAQWYQLQSSRTDGDADGYCVGAAGFDCIGSQALPGRRLTAACNATDDCNDTMVLAYRLVSSRHRR